MARTNLPSIYLYGGSIPPGEWNGKDVTIQDVFEAMGQVSRGTMTVAQLKDLECNACPTYGACGGMFTANTMASALEAIGLTVPNSAAPVAPSEQRAKLAYESGWAVMKVLESNTRPRDILTKEAFENAIAVVAGMGGSTNAVLHLLAIAFEAGVKLTMDDIERVGTNVPELADLRPAGKYVMSDVDRVGGVPIVMKQLLDAGLLHGDARMVTGEKPLGQACEGDVPCGSGRACTQSQTQSGSREDSRFSGGTSPPREVSSRPPGSTRNSHRGPAKVFNREEDARQAIMEKKVNAGRRGRRPLRGPEGRARDARDARGHRCASGPGPEGLRGSPDRREVLRAPPMGSWSATSHPRRP